MYQVPLESLQRPFTLFLYKPGGINTVLPIFDSGGGKEMSRRAKAAWQTQCAVCFSFCCLLSAVGPLRSISNIKKSSPNLCHVSWMVFQEFSMYHLSGFSKTTRGDGQKRNDDPHFKDGKTEAQRHDMLPSRWGPERSFCQYKSSFPFSLWRPWGSLSAAKQLPPHC